MATAKITSGICGFTATVRARKNGRKVMLEIDSDCAAIQALAAGLTEVDPFQEITFRGQGPQTLKAGAEHCYHPACPVPVGIIKAVEVESGLALPAEARIELSKDGED
ncbi:MAG: hypothetical protein GX597_12160 [Anaerolineaceae bacterium]|nr:hypothetical protein [Anaerolineae bacterium]MDX9831922.1 hypothetical protein [Anaerolineae bacterium]NLF12531.1 hypothetical protein [Anaerolineaceae bacterium]